MVNLADGAQGADPRAAAELFAARGFHGVSVGDVGAACGISGPALYRHFASKDTMLAEMLVSISEELLDGGRTRASRRTPVDALASLVRWHIDFALHNKSLIIVQDRTGPPCRCRRASGSATCSASTSSCGWCSLRRCTPSSMPRMAAPWRTRRSG